MNKTEVMSAIESLSNNYINERLDKFTNDHNLDPNTTYVSISLTDELVRNFYKNLDDILITLTPN